MDQADIKEFLSVSGSVEAVHDNYYPWYNVNMTKEKAEIVFEAAPEEGQRYMSVFFTVDYTLRGVFCESGEEDEYRAVYNNGIRYADGSYITDRNYPDSISTQYGKVILDIIQNGTIAQEQIKVIPIDQYGSGYSCFVLCLDLTDDSPVKIKFRIPLSYYLFCNKKDKELSKIEYKMDVERGEIRFSDNDRIYNTFVFSDTPVKTVEDIEPGNDGNVNLEEATTTDIDNLF